MSMTFSSSLCEAPHKGSSTFPLIRFQNITKRFHEKAALSSFHLDIREGEFFAFLGPSGCGKTTLLRMLAGFENPTEGKIFMDGINITDLPPYQRSSITMVFQSYALFPHMTVEKNIAFGLQQDSLAKSEIKVRVEEAMQMLEIQTLAQRKPQTLSGGQQQRVALARAIAKHPRILLLDEPLTALDKRLRAQAQTDLLRLQKKTNATFIIVTHDQEEAMTLANRIAVLDHGSLRQVGTPSEIYECPNSRHVAKFFGEINLFEGEIKTFENGMSKIFCPSLENILIVIGNENFARGQSVTLGVRPEKMFLSKQKKEGPFNSVKAKLRKISYLGALSYAHLLVGNHAEIMVLLSHTPETISKDILKDGEEVWVCWPFNQGRILVE